MSRSTSRKGSGTATATFDLSLSAPSPSTTSVTVRTLDGTATVANGDYVPISGQLVTFAPGQSTATVAVTVNGKVIVGTLKGGKARTVVVPAFVTDALARTAAAKARNDLLWTGRDGEHLSPPHGDQCWLSAALRRCQKSDPAFPSLTAHDLRHTAASLAVHAGANVKVLQRMLGHTSAAMTLDVYADLFESDLDAVAENVAKMWPSHAEAR